MGFGGRKAEEILSQNSTGAWDKVERETVDRPVCSYERGPKLIRLVKTRLQRASDVMLKSFGFSLQAMTHFKQRSECTPGNRF